MNSHDLLIIASTLFVGTHFIMSHPMRAALNTAFGKKGFQGFYSLISLITFGWMISIFRQVPVGPSYWQATDAIWIVASVLTLLASMLFLGSFIGNPAMANPDMQSSNAMAAKLPRGVFRVTRHPMMWGVALWGLSHILVAPRMENFIFIGSIIFLALAGAAGQDRKKAKLIGNGWKGWVTRTSFIPRLSQLRHIGVRLWLIGILFWVCVSYAHGWFGAYGAGIYRWL